jgi:hypothetical protein
MACGFGEVAARGILKLEILLRDGRWMYPIETLGSLPSVKATHQYVDEM